MMFFDTPLLCIFSFVAFLLIMYVATLLLEKWEDDIHTPKMGTWESVGTPETLEFGFRGQNTLH
jgi:hypothetical protein